MLPPACRRLIIVIVMRRIFVSELRAGPIALSADQAHHVRNVLRLSAGDPVELFDAIGQVSRAVIERSDDRAVRVMAEPPTLRDDPSAIHLTVAAAVPKGDRADWMIEKLSELGVDAFVPLKARRSVVLPEGRNKRQRWQRLAAESAKQSRRRGVMGIGELTPLHDAVGTADVGWCLSTASENVRPIALMLASPAPASLTLYVGPEGGWAQEEIALFEQRGIASVSLTPSILRVETAAIVAAAAILLVSFNSRGSL